MRKSSVQIVVRKNRPTPFTVKFREMGQRKTLAFKTRSEAEIFANTLKRSKRLPDDVMLNSSDLMAFMRLKSACEASGISLEAGVEKAISSLITPNDYINGGLSLAAALEKFVKTREALNSRSSTIADYSTYIAKAQNFFGADRAIKTITKRDLDELLDTQERLSVKKALCVKLRIFFKYFRQKEWMNENVAETLTVESRRETKKTPRFSRPNRPRASSTRCRTILAFWHATPCGRSRGCVPKKYVRKTKRVGLNGAQSISTNTSLPFAEAFQRCAKIANFKICPKIFGGSWS